MIEAAPGLEHYPPNASKDASPQVVNDLRREHIRKDLEQNLLPRDTQDRVHRANQGAINGAMSFLELGKLMDTSWKRCDDFAKSVFNGLADEGRGHYRQRLKEYRASSEGLPKVGSAKVSSNKKNKSVEKKNARKVSPGLAMKDDQRKSNMFKDDETCSSSNVSEATSRSLFYKPDASDGSHEVMKMATNSIFIASKDYSVSQKIKPHQDHLKNETVATLQARVKELEAQLVAERLRSRIKQLDSELVWQKVTEDQFRAQLGMLPRNGTSAAANPSSIQDGLSSLVSASTVH